MIESSGDAHAPRHEAEAFFDALQAVPAQAVTACRGWTTHELIAHLASGADALANQIEAYFDGAPIPEFGSWQERELPYRSVDDAGLRRRLEAAEARMSAGFDVLLDDVGADAAIGGVGFGFPVGELIRHMRQEFAVHRWDLVGDDADGAELLAQPELLGHCVRMLAEPLLATGLQRDPAPGAPLEVRLRAPGEPDLVLSVAAGTGTLALSDRAEIENVIECDSAARLLLLWGRHPADARRVRSRLAADTLMRVQTILAGF